MIKYLHTMVRVTDLEQSIDFYCNKMGLKQVSRKDNEKGRYTLVFVAPKGQEDCAIELTYNWGPESYTGGRNFGHVAYEVDNIYDYCEALVSKGVVINRPPRDGWMAFIKSPDNISIEILQKGTPLTPKEPWLSMKNIGSW
jgi:lactoylglutathione lyase